MGQISGGKKTKLPELTQEDTGKPQITRLSNEKASH